MSSAQQQHPLVLDRRRARRERLLVRAQIVADGNFHDCILLDLTATGARIETMLPLALPDHFALRFSNGRQEVCERRWRVGQRMGLMFLRPDTAPDRSRQAMAMLGVLDTVGHVSLFEALRRENYLQSAGLGEAVWRAESAFRAMEERLRSLAAGE